MAHFAKIGNDSIVIEVHVVVNEVITDNDGNEQESLGKTFLNTLFKTNDNWVQTSYNTWNGVHKLGGTPLRKHFAGIGALYNAGDDAFSNGPKPYPSWTLNTDTYVWEPPVARPDDLDNPAWDEDTQAWVEKLSA